MCHTVYVYIYICIYHIYHIYIYVYAWAKNCSSMFIWYIENYWAGFAHPQLCTCAQKRNLKFVSRHFTGHPFGSENMFGGQEPFEIFEDGQGLNIPPWFHFPCLKKRKKTAKELGKRTFTMAPWLVGVILSWCLKRPLLTFGIFWLGAQLLERLGRFIHSFMV